MEDWNSSISSGPSGLVSADDHAYKHHHRQSQTRDHPHWGGVSSNTILIIVMTLVSMVIVFSIIFILFMLRRLKTANKNGSSKDNATGSSRFVAPTTLNFDSSPDVRGGCLHGGNLNRTVLTPKCKGVQVFTYRELEQATDGFSEQNLIGNGGFGVTYRGVLIDGAVAAIKMIREQGKQGERAFRIEVDLLSRLESPYLVELLGYCADQHHRLLVYEYMSNGTLHHHLHSTQAQSQTLDWGSRLRIALDCARALKFLHEHATPPVIHRDFKSTHVLLDDNFRAKVSDFGLAKMGSEKINGQISTRVLGTTGYLAPEYASTGKLTTKSDVYSYGVVLLELLTCRVPVDSRRPPGEHVLYLGLVNELNPQALPRLTNREKVVEMVDPILKRHPVKDLIQVAAIAAMCVQPEADYRPLMTDVVQSLVPLVKNSSCGSTSSSLRFQIQTPGQHK